MVHNNKFVNINNNRTDIQNLCKIYPYLLHFDRYNDNNNTINSNNNNILFF